MNKEPLIPVLVRVLLREEGREKIDEFLAVPCTKVPPNRNLPALAIIEIKLHGPRVHDDGQRNVT